MGIGLFPRWTVQGPCRWPPNAHPVQRCKTSYNYTSPFHLNLDGMLWSKIYWLHWTASLFKLRTRGPQTALHFKDCSFLYRHSCFSRHTWHLTLILYYFRTTSYFNFCTKYTRFRRIASLPIWMFHFFSPKSLNARTERRVTPFYSWHLKLHVLGYVVKTIVSHAVFIRALRYSWKHC